MDEKIDLNDTQVVTQVEEQRSARPNIWEAAHKEGLTWHDQKADFEAQSNVPERWLNPEDTSSLKTRWNEIQAEFVDNPHKSVEMADEMVVETLQRIEQLFSEKRMILDERWMNQTDISTEDLRVSLQYYHAFLNRLLEL